MTAEQEIARLTAALADAEREVQQRTEDAKTYARHSRVAMAAVLLAAGGSVREAVINTDHVVSAVPIPPERTRVSSPTMRVTFVDGTQLEIVGVVTDLLETV